MGSEYTDRVWHRQEPVTPATESFCRKNPLIFPQTFRQLDTCMSRKPTEGTEKCPVPGARIAKQALGTGHWALVTGHFKRARECVRAFSSRPQGIVASL